MRLKNAYIIKGESVDKDADETLQPYTVPMTLIAKVVLEQKRACEK